MLTWAKEKGGAQVRLLRGGRRRLVGARHPDDGHEAGLRPGLHRPGDRRRGQRSDRRHADLRHRERRRVAILPPEVDGMYDYTPLQDPSYGARSRASSPRTRSGGITSYEDWQAKWQEIKA